MIMGTKHIFLFILLLAFSQMGLSQDKSKNTSKSMANYKVSLVKAYDVFKEKPDEAIEIIRDVIEKARINNDVYTEAKSYTILGEIYAQINQYTLAQLRYNKALDLFKSINKTEQITIIYSLGNLHLKNSNTKKAEEKFQECIAYQTKHQYLSLCQEGLADTQLQSGEEKEAMQIYDQLVKQYSAALDSVNLSRIEAKRSLLFTQQNKFEPALDAYNNSIKKQNIYIEEEADVIDNAKESLLSNFKRPKQEIEIRNAYINKQIDLDAPLEKQIDENVKLADAYVASNEINNAKRVIKTSKALIETGTVAPASKSKLLKAASKIEEKQGNYSKALEDYRAYVDESEKAFEKRKTALDKKIKILNQQAKIDIDDKDYAFTQREESYSRTSLQFQQLLIGLLSLLLIGAITFIVMMLKNNRERNKTNQLLLLKTLGNQMNPHFIFNALNSVNNFISKNDERAANKFLADFSKLMRVVLENSKHDLITLEEELDLVQRYIKLEHMRFRDKFTFEIDIDDTLDGTKFQIPPMLIQPFVENAVWHGLRYKKSQGILKFACSKKGDRVQISIIDDGIGRQQSSSLKTKNQKKYNSTGLSNTKRRIELINKIYKKQYVISIEDASIENIDCGTCVTILV